ncbi:metallophosphoesterase family protein [Rhodopseudomonas sp. P2A-2r]|uniref:metallophosphoesterase family protein n=1 Tax=Rhodopseudomonas sp. P2A-2r TaxID=2991972 RepID=UPI0029FF266D|nr:metallophosphoesterase [Rhodopseudomonas sp. P2A-2r]
METSTIMRFSFIHAADLHIDSPLAGLGLKDRAVAERFAHAGRRAVEALVSEAIDSKAAFLIIAGDVFDGDWRDVSTGLFFVRAIGALHRAGIPTVIVKGNHDFESGMSRSLPYPDSVKFFSSRKAETIALDAHRVALHGRSFPTRLVLDNFVDPIRLAARAGSISACCTLRWTERAAMTVTRRAPSMTCAGSAMTTGRWAMSMPRRS